MPHSSMWTKKLDKFAAVLSLDAEQVSELHTDDPQPDRPFCLGGEITMQKWSERQIEQRRMSRR